MSHEQIISEYPHVNEEDIKAVLQYSADIVSKEEILA